MKITCKSCGKKYDTQENELCPNCGSYNSTRQAESEQTASDTVQPAEKQPEKNEPKKGNWSMFVVSRLIICSVILLLVQQAAELIRIPIRSYLMGQTGSVAVSEYQPNESFALDNGVLVSVEGLQSVDLKPEWYQELSQYQMDLTDMKMAAILFRMETAGEALTADNGKAFYLKANGHAYKPLYIQKIEEDICSQYDASPVGMDDEEEGRKAVVFLAAEEDLDGEQIFCIQQKDTVSIFDIEKTTSRIQIPLHKEA